MKRMMYEKKEQDKEDTSDEESEDEGSDTEEEEDPPTYRTRRGQTKRERFADETEKITLENNRDDETVEEATEVDANDTEETDEEAKEADSTSDTGARGSDSIPPASQSRAGRTLKPTARLIEQMQAQMQARADVISITAADLQYMQQMIDHLNDDDMMADVMGVGAGVGGGFTNTAESHVLNYKQTMESEDREEWKKEVQNEKKRFVPNALTPVKRKDVPSAKIMTSTWAMKKKSNGKFRGRLNLQGFEQRDGEHFISTSISSPVTNATTVRIALKC